VLLSPCFTKSTFANLQKQRKRKKERKEGRKGGREKAREREKKELKIIRKKAIRKPGMVVHACKS
jgi:hypothetical protein